MPDPKSPAAGALEGVRVLDLTALVLGPYATSMLGDFGADVIKVEGPEGDMTRNIGPRHLPGMSAQYVNLNRNKRSVVLDLKTDAGRDALLAIARESDVFITNMRSPVLERLGVTYDDIVTVNPEIAYCRVVGYGSDNSRRDDPVIDDVAQAISGLVALQNDLTGTPSYVAMPIADMACGLIALTGVLAALYRKAVTGKGEEIELTMFEGMASFVLTPNLSGGAFVPPLSTPVYQRSVTPNRRPYRTADGVVCVAPITDRHFSTLLSLIGREDLLQDARFNTLYARSQNLNDLYAEVEKELLTRSTAQWIQAFEIAGVPYAPVHSTTDLLEDEYLNASGFFDIAEHPTEGTMKLVANPLRLTHAPTRLRRLPVHLGQHTEEVLGEIGRR